jgi:hypothetical protein
MFVPLVRETVLVRMVKFMVIAYRWPAQCMVIVIISGLVL